MQKLKIWNKRAGQYENILISNDDFERVSEIKWYIYWSGHGYRVYGTFNKKLVTLANFIHDDYNLMFDHKDGNPFNNQRENLRAADRHQNSWNRKKTYYKKYKGTTYNSKLKKYLARIKHYNKLENLGYFQTEEEAAKAYDAKAKELFGEFASLNFPE